MEPFSILIPTWNNLPMLRLCVESLRRNSAVEHQIVVHVNDGSDGTLDYVRAEGLDYTHTPRNTGVCLAMNMMRTKVRTNYICFVNDDMYALPGWDRALWEEIARLPDNRFFLSATTIQRHVAPGETLIRGDYGSDTESFREDDLLREYMDADMPDWAGATLPPNIVHRDLWDLVGGYSVEFSPGMYSDPDFTAKLWHCGVRYMRGIGRSRFYYFETRSTSRIRKNRGQDQFLMKWGMTSSAFRRLFTRRGQPFDPAFATPAATFAKPATQLLRARLKAVALLLTRHFGPQRMPWDKQ